VVIGDVHIGEDSSVWPLSVVRGDVNYIRIGARTNIQDGSVLQVMKDEYPLILEDDVHRGARVTLHAASSSHAASSGMGAIILNGAKNRVRQHRGGAYAGGGAHGHSPEAWSWARRAGQARAHGHRPGVD